MPDDILEGDQCVRGRETIVTECTRMPLLRMECLRMTIK